MYNHCRFGDGYADNGLMEYGSIFGHGAYLGPDLTADDLHRAALLSEEHNGGSASETARQQTIADFKANGYDEASGVLTFSPAQTEAFEYPEKKKAAESQNYDRLHPSLRDQQVTFWLHDFPLCNP